MASRTLTPSQVADLLKVHPDTVYEIIRRGDLRASNVGSPARPRYRVRERDFERYLDLTQVRGIELDAGEVA